MIEQIAPNGLLRHLITLDGLDRQLIEQLLERARHYLLKRGSAAPRDNSLRGFTVANLFFEASTRTRASFELAAKRLDAEVLNLDVNTSSRIKGESILDTIYTLEAMHIDIFVVRDASTGVPEMIAEAVAPDVCVLNAGESDAAHPTQGLLDLLTIQLHKGDISKLCVTITGDIRHSRVARSAAHALRLFNVGELRFVGPEEFLPDESEFPEARRFHDLDAGLSGADVVMALRIQKERFSGTGAIPDSDQYFRDFGLTARRLRVASPDVIVMHPGPMNRGTEIDSEVADSVRSVI
ncbi:MAG: aspartate carbamoyltransferase catalytic subunit, partial [Gammaproteobacteria bacterium]